MFRWALAAIGILVLSTAISVAAQQLIVPSPTRFGPQAYERVRQIDLQYQEVPFVRLLANPERYNGRKVRVSGFVTLAFEGTGLHLDRTSYEAGLRKNAIWLERPRWLNARDTQRLDRRNATVAGTFEAMNFGHYGLYAGTLIQLRLISPIRTAADHTQWLMREKAAAVNQALLSSWFLTVVGWTGLWVLWMLTKRRS